MSSHLVLKLILILLFRSLRKFGLSEFVSLNKLIKRRTEYKLIKLIAFMVNHSKFVLYNLISVLEQCINQVMKVSFNLLIYHPVFWLKLCGKKMQNFKHPCYCYRVSCIYEVFNELFHVFVKLYKVSFFAFRLLKFRKIFPIQLKLCKFVTC